jgi:hypothetical protein
VVITPGLVPRGEREMLRAIIVIVGALSTCFLSEGHAQKTPKRIETPNEKFERKGGRSIKTRVIVGRDGEIAAATVTKGRDIQLYDQGGHFDCRMWSPTALKNHQENSHRIDSALETARNFILEHWQNKKRGYIRVTLDSVDAVSTSHIFIEPDASGKWQITWRIARWHAMIPSGIDDLPTIRQVEQKINNVRAPSLIFRDADGEEWQVL